MEKSNGVRKIKNFCRNTYLFNKATNKTLGKIERKFKLKEGVLVKAKRAAIIAAAVAIPATVGVKTATNEYVFYTAKDSIADEYIDGVPLTTEDGKTTVIPDGNLIIYEEKIDFDKKTVQAIDANGNIVEGEITEDYLEKIGDIKKEELEEHSTIYKVDISGYSNDSEEYLNISVPIQKETDVTSDEKAKINNGSLVFGLPVYDGSKWIEVIYVNDNKVVKGYMLSQYLKEVQNLEIGTEKEEDNSSAITMIVDTSKDNNIDLNLRSEKKIGDNIIIKIPNGKEVTLVTGEIEKEKTRDWYQVEYRDEEEDKYYVGYVDASYLKEYGTIKMQVATEKSDLNLRAEPNEKGKIIGRLKKGTIIEVVQGQGEGDWVKVKLSDKTSGYVNSKYLEKVEEKTKEKSDVKVSLGEGEILGIDSVGLTKTQLSQMLESSGPLGTANDAYANRKIEFVYIKIGGCGYQNFKTTGIPSEAINQIKACEEAGVPYGFYFYSTCRTNEEAEVECDIIEQNLEEIGKAVELKYNLLPIAIDVEIGEKDELERQHYSNWPEMQDDHEGAIESVTNAKAFEANKLEAMFGERPIIYIGTRASLESDDQIFDFDIYEEGVGYTPYIWYTAPYENNTTEMSNKNKTGIKNVKKQAFIQSTLDAFIRGVKVDVNRGDSETIKELIGEEHIIEEKTVTEEKQTEDVR